MSEFRAARTFAFYWFDKAIVGLQPTVIASRAPHVRRPSNKAKEKWNHNMGCLTLRPIFTFNKISLKMWGGSSRAARYEGLYWFSNREAWRPGGAAPRRTQRETETIRVFRAYQVKKFYSIFFNFSCSFGRDKPITRTIL